MDKALAAMVNSVTNRSTANVTISVKSPEEVKLLLSHIQISHVFKPSPESPIVSLCVKAEHDVRLASKCVDRVKTLLFRKIIKKYSNYNPIYGRDFYRIARVSHLFGRQWVTALLFKAQKQVNRASGNYFKSPVVFDEVTSSIFLKRPLVRDKPFQNRPIIRGISVIIDPSNVINYPTVDERKVKEFNRLLRDNVVGEIETLEAITKVNSSLKVLQDAFLEYGGSNTEIEYAPILVSIEDLADYEELLVNTAKSYASVAKELVKDYDKALYRVCGGADE